MGRLHAGEGVLGLRRAFEQAGVETLIMSLWPVEDEATRMWMRELYRSRLAGLGVPQAAREASLRVIRSARDRSGQSHPYFWGAFLTLGEWR
jgi:CHAT domain-containing protein